MNRRNFLKYSLLSAGAALAASYPTLIERNIVQINHYTIPITTLPPAFHGFRIAQLTDLHHGFLVSESFLKGVIKRTNDLHPDMVVCTGDYVHARNSKSEIDRVWPIMAELRVKEGVYSVLGNHDHWADAQRSLYWLNQTGQNIRHSCKAIHRGNESIIIGGSGDRAQDRYGLFQCLTRCLQDPSGTQPGYGGY